MKSSADIGWLRGLWPEAAGMTALGRVGEPDDIGPMIASSLSDASRWVTAQWIEVSGGMNLGAKMIASLAMLETA